MLLEACQQLLNRAVADSEPARQRIERLEGESFTVDIDGLGLSVNMTVDGGELRLELGGGRDSRARLQAAPFDLLRLLQSGSIGRIVDSRAELSGNAQVAEAFSDLLRLLEPDFEEELSRWVGDVAAHGLADAARGFAAWLLHAKRASESNLSEYLQEESGLLPRPGQAEELGAAIDRVRDAVDRAEQRLQRIRQTVDARS